MTGATKTILFDLDETLMPELPSNNQAFCDACRHAHERAGIDADALFTRVQETAEAIWKTSAFYNYTESIGIASWEGMWGEFSGDHPRFDEMRAFVPTFRRQAWHDALQTFGIDRNDLSDELDRIFRARRRAIHRLYPDTIETLQWLRPKRRLAMITNGVPDIQWTKIRAVGIEKYFDAIVISGEHGIGKPDPQIFDRALQAIGGTRETSVMIGNSLSRDILGAKNAGIRAIWVQTDDCERPVDVIPDATIHQLSELPDIL
jgi:putative hydrolase of the HAD superfamily